VHFTSVLPVLERPPDMVRWICSLLTLLVLAGALPPSLCAQRTDTGTRSIQLRSNGGARLPDFRDTEPQSTSGTLRSAQGELSESNVEHGSDPIPISLSASSPRERPDLRPPPSPAGSIVTVISSLAIVLGLFGVFIWFSRRGLSRGITPLSNEVVEALGRMPLTARQHLHLLRVANKLLLVVVSPDGAKTLTEITEPDEVLRICALCEQSKSSSVTSSFREIFSHLNSQRTADRNIENSPLSSRNSPGRPNA